MSGWAYKQRRKQVSEGEWVTVNRFTAPPILHHGRWKYIPAYRYTAWTALCGRRELDDHLFISEREDSVTCKKCEQYVEKYS